jgi:hypothetical protein
MTAGIAQAVHRRERAIDLNLITFSGFVFSFGYVSQLAYYAKPFRQAAPRMALAAVKTLLAFERKNRLQIRRQRHLVR